jgi:hypothetical protein
MARRGSARLGKAWLGKEEFDHSLKKWSYNTSKTQNETKNKQNLQGEK